MFEKKHIENISYLYMNDIKILQSSVDFLININISINVCIYEVNCWNIKMFKIMINNNKLGNDDILRVIISPIPAVIFCDFDCTNCMNNNSYLDIQTNLNKKNICIYISDDKDIYNIDIYRNNYVIKKNKLIE